jgi:hypothetical protein
MRLSKFSIPAFRVMVDDGQPLHEPRSSTVTTPSSNERYADSAAILLNSRAYVVVQYLLNLDLGFGTFKINFASACSSA